MTNVNSSVADKATVFLLRANFLVGLAAAVLGFGVTIYAGTTRLLPLVGVAFVAVIYSGWRLGKLDGSADEVESDVELGDRVGDPAR